MSPDAAPALPQPPPPRSPARGRGPYAWLAAGIALLAAVVAVQTRDAYLWALNPWPGFTLLDHGRIAVRSLAEAPEALRPLLEAPPGSGSGEPSVVARAVSAPSRAGWIELEVPGDPPQAAADRLGRALAPLAPGSRFRLRVDAAGGAPREIELVLGRVPARVIVERCVLFAGLGLVLAAIGLLVLGLRPESSEARRFALAMFPLGIELLASPVTGGFPSRLGWLSVLASFVAPPLAAQLALALGPPLRRTPLAALPWLASLGAALASAYRGTLHDDSSLELRALRVAGWVFFAGYLLWARAAATSRRRARQLELYLVGLALAFAPPLLWYTPAHANGNLPSPWVMLSLLLFPAAIGYGIVKHRLFDIEVVVRGGLTGTALLLVGGAVYGMLVWTASSLLGVGAARSPAATTGFVLVAVAVGGALRRRLQRAVERGLDPARARYLAALRDATAELALLDRAGEIGSRLVRTATEVAGLPGAAVFQEGPQGLALLARAGSVHAPRDGALADSAPIVNLLRLLGSELHRQDFDENPRLRPLAASCTATLDAIGADVLVPLGGGRRGLEGVLALAARPGGRSLDGEDLALLKTLAGAGAAALWRARSSEETRDRPLRPEAVAPSPAPGARIAHYRLEAELGRGGAGAVFRALDERLGRTVALKFLLDPGRDPVALERVRREARTLAALAHPAVVQIFALEEAEGHTFLAMELVDGASLAQELGRRGRFDPREAVEVAIEVAGALGYAHERGVIHRDVKLQNVLRTASGKVKLADFGLAKLGGSASSLTGQGGIVGTPAYLAPELLLREEASFRSDMWSLGVTLHVLLTGRGVWDAPGTDPWNAPPGGPEPEALRALGVPEPLAVVLKRLLRRSPEERFPDYASLRAALADARDRL